MMKDMWNERYGAAEFAYGKNPNEFFRQQLNNFQPGKLLMPAEGEGRNAVYAATQGWDVTAFDQSSEGKKKADALAQEMNMRINYLVCNMNSVQLEQNSFDAIGLIYAHFPADLKSAFHKTLATFLKPGGIIIFEAFSKSNLEYVKRNEKVGGPKDVDMLFSIEELQQDFSGFEILYCKEEETELSEGLYHNGTGSVIRFVGRKTEQ